MKNFTRYCLYKVLLLLLLAPISEIQAQCTDGCEEISTLPCSEIVKALPYVLDFNGQEGGMQDQSGIGTGFSMVQWHSENRLPQDGSPSCSFVKGYEPSRLQINNGFLNMDAAKGIAYLDPPQSSNNNNQINTLGIGLQVQNTVFCVETQISNLQTGGRYAQTGLWYGLDEDNFVKLVVVNENTVELRIEEAGSSNTDLVKSISGLSLGGKDIQLRFKIDYTGFSPSIEGFYQEGQSNAVSLGSLNLPSSFSEGTFLGANNNVTYAGIFASYRNGSPYTISYDSFKVEALQTTGGFEGYKVNFSDAATSPGPGWIRDSGLPYGYKTEYEQSFGWVQENNPAQTLDISNKGRNRNFPSDNLHQATLMHMQLAGLHGIWEMALPNRSYRVTVSVGDGGGYTDSQYAIQVEGQTLFNSFTPTAREFREDTLTVEVQDGKLSIDALGGTNTKINYVLIEPVGDLERPEILSLNVDKGQSNVSQDVLITTQEINLPNGPINPTTVNDNTVFLRNNDDNSLVLAHVSLLDTNQRISLVPLSPLSAGVSYTFNVTEEVQDDQGGTFQSFSLPFTVENPAPPVDPNQIMINFQDANTSTPEGWQADNGRSFGTQNLSFAGNTLSYGWINALDRQNPKDMTAQASNQDANATDQALILATGINPTISTEPLNAGIWELELPDGQYDVEVTVGNVVQSNQSQSLKVEGQKFFENSLNSTSQNTLTLNKPVYVADGKLTVEAFAGTTTRLLSIKLRQLNVLPEFTWKYRFNFQKSTTQTPSGYIADNGLAYSEKTDLNGQALIYGWLEPIGQDPIAIEAEMRDRNKSPIESNTFAHMQNSALVHWAVNLPNGLYKVQVSAGDIYKDSEHQVNAEGTMVLRYNQQGLNQTGSQVAMGIVEVNDGRLELDPIGGLNTKINYVWIASIANASDNLAPKIELEYQGNELQANTYQSGLQVNVEAFDLGDAGLASVEYQINNAGWSAYRSPLFFEQPGNYTLNVRATDNNGNTAEISPVTFKVEVPQPGLGKLSLENMDHFPADNELTFSRVQIPWINHGPLYNSNHDKVNLRLHNLGLGSLQVDSFKISNNDYWIIEQIGGTAFDPNTQLPLQIAAGSSVDVLLKFVATDVPDARSERLKVLHEKLYIYSQDAERPITEVALHGLWQRNGEGNREPWMNEIIDAFGFKTNTGFTNYRHGSDSTAIGDEIMVKFFEKADPAKSVYVRQLASYQGCCESGTGFYYSDNDPYANKKETKILHSIGQDTQSLLPRLNKNGSDGNFGLPAEANIDPNGIFNVTIANDCSNSNLNYPTDWNPATPGYVGIRVWKLRNSAGQIVPNAYLMANDYLGKTSNWDYNDNLYVLTNVRPVDVPENYSELATGTGVEVHPDGKQSELLFDETNIGGQSSRTLYLRSLGQIYPEFNDPDIQIFGVEVTGANPDEFEISEPLDNLLSPGESTSLNIDFRPYRKGLKNATLLVHYNSANSPRRIPLYGTASSDCINATLIKRIKTATPNNAPMNIGSQSWESDLSYRANTSDFTSAQTNDQATEIGLTDQDALYRSFAVANAEDKALYYQIPLANGSYNIRLHFAERYYQEANERAFHVQIENIIAEVGLDVFAEVGFNNALAKDYEVSINDGVLNIDLLPIQSKPYLMGIEIYAFSNPNGLSLDLVNQQAATCGFENGSFEVSLSGTPLPALFKLGKYGTYQSNAVFADLAPGTYTVFAKEDGLEACELSRNITVANGCQFKATDESDETQKENLSAVKTEGNDSFISIYPNPFIEDIQINASDDLVSQKNIILKVYTLQEKLIFNTSGDLNSLAEALQKQAPQMKPGVYIFKFYTESDTYESKVVKQ